MRKLVLCAYMVTLLAALAVAQPHPGGVIVGGGYPDTNLSYLNGVYLAGKNGTFTTIVDTYFTSRPYWADDLQMCANNRSVMFASRYTSSSLYPMKYGLFRYDVATGKFVTVAMHIKDFRRIYGFTADQDGDWLVCSQCYDTSNKTTYGIFKVSNAGTWTTLLTTAGLGHPQSLTYPVRRDIDTGHLLIPSNNKVGFFVRPVYALSPYGTITTWNTSNGGPQPTYGWSQEIASGDIVYNNGNYLYRCPPGRGAMAYKRLTGVLPSSTYTYGMVYENQSAAAPQLIMYGTRQLTTMTQSSLYWVDPATAKVTSIKSFITANKKVSAPWWQSIIGQYQGRNIQMVKTAHGKWDMLFSFPAYPKKRYVVACTLSGVRPGLMLPDGRRIWINFDDLVEITVDNKIPFVFNPGSGTLDANGEAKGSIDISWLNLPINWTAHIIVGVLDQSAPYGIGFISEPYPFRF